MLLVAGLGSRVIRVQPSPSLKHSATAVRFGLLHAADCINCLAAASRKRGPAKTPSAGTCGHRCVTKSQAVWLQVDEMDKAVDVAEKRMNQFGLTTQEIRNRRNWVHATRRTVSLIYLIKCFDPGGSSGWRQDVMLDAMRDKVHGILEQGSRLCGGAE